MPVTAQQIITRSMKALQVLGNTETPSAAESNDALVAFNAMLDSWSNMGLAAYRVDENSFPLVVGTSSYTVGSGGDVNIERPLEITEAYIQDTGGNNYEMKIMPRDWWNKIGNRSSTITSQIPDVLFYDPQYPLGVINIFPTPLIAYTCYFDGMLDQPTFATLATDLAMPKGYERAYVLNLAVEIASMMGIPIPAVAAGQKNIAMLAAEALAAIKTTNMKEQIAEYDPMLVSRANSTYNIYRDSGGG